MTCGYVPPSVPLSVGGVLDEWLRIFRASFRRSWTPPLFMIPLTAWMQFYMVSPVVYRSTHAAPLGQALMQIASTFGTARNLGSQFVLFVAAVGLRGLVMAQQVSVVRGDGTATFRSSLQDGLRRLPRLILVLLLALLISAAVLVAGSFGVGALIGLAEGAISIAPTAERLVATSLIIIVGAYLWVRLGLSLAAIFADDYGAAASLARSWRLVKGHWWRVAGVVFVATIVIWIVALSFTGLVNILVLHVLMSGAPSAHRLAFVMTSIGNVVIEPLAAAVELAIYFDLRLRLEGGDLAARVEALSAASHAA